jgi:hypothetical protein
MPSVYALITSISKMHGSSHIGRMRGGWGADVARGMHASSGGLRRWRSLLHDVPSDTMV